MGYNSKENDELIFLIIIVRYNLRIVRINSNSNIEILTLLPLPDKKKKNTAVVKRDKTSGLDRNDHQKSSRLQAAHTSYQKRFNKVLSFVVMGASKDFLWISVLCRV